MRSTPTKIRVALKVTKRLPIESSEKKPARFSARNQANPGTVRFCRKIIKAAYLMGSLKEALLNRTFANHGAVVMTAMVAGTEVSNNSTTTVEQTPARSLSDS